MTANPINALKITGCTAKHTNNTQIHFQKSNISKNKKNEILKTIFIIYQISIIHVLHILYILQILYILYITFLAVLRPNCSRAVAWTTMTGAAAPAHCIVPPTNHKQSQQITTIKQKHWKIFSIFETKPTS